eukprot:NODE_8636_length_218_cov_13.041420_g8553_i0.p2 GENE.NODE_8636_length_218_cov_13.041420_g8553_i0~~NODE_8636_length_218_cov_13.041420_g8553_i0.p2  ORF type:complete len:55 (-),score=2.58 NODE_8636_length_218_cov_13.041420_g8553_i0:24-188(-)
MGYHHTHTIIVREYNACFIYNIIYIILGTPSSRPAVPDPSSRPARPSFGSFFVF